MKKLVKLSFLVLLLNINVMALSPPMVNPIKQIQIVTDDLVFLYDENLHAIYAVNIMTVVQDLFHFGIFIKFKKNDLETISCNVLDLIRLTIIYGDNITISVFGDHQIFILQKSLQLIKNLFIDPEHIDIPTIEDLHNEIKYLTTSSS